MPELSPESWELWNLLRQEPSLDEDLIKENFLEEKSDRINQKGKSTELWESIKHFRECHMVPFYGNLQEQFRFIYQAKLCLSWTIGLCHPEDMMKWAHFL